jgi:hypothetical protein
MSTSSQDSVITNLYEVCQGDRGYVSPMEVLTSVDTLVKHHSAPKFWKIADKYRTKKIDKGFKVQPYCYMPTGHWIELILPGVDSITNKDGFMSLARGSQALGKNSYRDDPYMTTHGLYADMYGLAFSIAAMGAWRLTKGIYEFDPTLTDCLVKTSIKGKLPTDVLYRLPAWCVYIPTPNSVYRMCRDEGGMTDVPLHGFFAFIDHHIKGRSVSSWLGMPEVDPKFSQAQASLILVLNMGKQPLREAEGLTSTRLSPVAVPLGDWDLEEAMSRTVSAHNYLCKSDPQRLAELTTAAVHAMTPLVSMVMYLCSANAEISSRKSSPVTKRDILSRPPPTAPTTWDVGVRIGSAIRYGQKVIDSDLKDSVCPLDNPLMRRRFTMRPHWRSAHWSTYHIGKGRQESVVKWICPVLVNSHISQVDDLPVVIHPVKEKDSA